MEVGLGPGHIVLDGDPARPKKGRTAPNFLRTEVGFDPGDNVLDGDPALPPKRVGSPQFSANVYCVQIAVCIRIPLTTEVGLSLDNTVLDRDLAPPPLKGTTTNFRLMSVVAKVD